MMWDVYFSDHELRLTKFNSEPYNSREVQEAVAAVEEEPLDDVHAILIVPHKVKLSRKRRNKRIAALAKVLE